MHLSISLINFSIFSFAAEPSPATPKVVNLLFQVFNPLPAGLILCLAPLKLRLEPYTLRSLRLIQRDQLFDICLYTFKHFLKA